VSSAAAAAWPVRTWHSKLCTEAPRQACASLHHRKLRDVTIATQVTQCVRQLMLAICWCNKVPTAAKLMREPVPVLWRALIHINIGLTGYSR